MKAWVAVFFVLLIAMTSVLVWRHASLETMAIAFLGWLGGIVSVFALQAIQRERALAQ